MWFRKDKTPRAPRDPRTSSSLGEGLFLKCEGCRETLYLKEVERNRMVCPKCGFHFRLPAEDRLKLLFDGEAYQPLFGDVRPADPLKFKDTKRYRDRLREYEAKTGRPDAVLAGMGRIDGVASVMVVLDYSFMGGSMGSVVGEVLTRAAELSLREKSPLVVVTASGGARMQEGILSLMQMGKVSAAIGRLFDARIPYVAILTDPTTGGVTASFAMQGDVTIAEPKALIGFAGPRVIEQTIRQTLPDGFQRSEFLEEHGFVDIVVPRGEMKATVGTILKLLAS
ncbi:MAG TPA: acetyl-CoA carboxylase, carboxyltransferase subunit beta [Thermoanaerobaculia bacterium]|jgi:acetyl-CoA carboxylase carboxyl transferase subunit beta|nr:acetyl-CoA carboxylase, carboxyltransferase subunit beta [Thermoanaerobaculia bacterium]